MSFESNIINIFKSDRLRYFGGDYIIINSKDNRKVFIFSDSDSYNSLSSSIIIKRYKNCKIIMYRNIYHYYFDIGYIRVLIRRRKIFIIKRNVCY